MPKIKGISKTRESYVKLGQELNNKGLKCTDLNKTDLNLIKTDIITSDIRLQADPCKVKAEEVTSEQDASIPGLGC